MKGLRLSVFYYWTSFQVNCLALFPSSSLLQALNLFLPVLPLLPVDLRPWQMAQVVQLRLIQHVKYPFALCSLGVDYSNDGSLIFGISVQTYRLINWLYPTTHSRCKEPPWCMLLCVIMYYYSIFNMLEGSASMSATQIRLIKLGAEMMWHFARAVKCLLAELTLTL